MKYEFIHSNKYYHFTLKCHGWHQNRRIYLQYFAFNTNWKSFSVWYNNKKDSYLFGTGDKCEIVAGWKSVTNVATTNKIKLKLTIKTEEKKMILWEADAIDVTHMYVNRECG